MIDIMKLQVLAFPVDSNSKKLYNRNVEN